MRVLTVNAGSSSLKLHVVADGEVLAAGDGSLDAGTDEIASLADQVGGVDAVGHRFVHGGAEHVEPEPVTHALVTALEHLVPLAPLHQPAALRGVEAAGRALPGVPAVACFDTAFHRDLPAAAATYAVPREWRERFGLRRFGAHGLSFAYASRRALEMVPDARRVVVAHVGSGASVCAVLDGRSVDTTMGFTPMEGVVMATRSGSVDPGLLLWLLEHGGLSSREVHEGLDRAGGLTGLAGTGDHRELEGRLPDEQAALALDVQLRSVAAAVAAMTTSLRGLDVLVLTGGVAQRSSHFLHGLVERLPHLGVGMDRSIDDGVVPDVDVSAPWARARTLVLAAREELEIAAGTVAVVGRS
ncbi:acetate/propionate family kinase [Angustibacter speluncae]